eukprot:PhM_4_TR5224/c0_g1_i1/m.54887
MAPLHVSSVINNKSNNNKRTIESTGTARYVNGNVDVDACLRADCELLQRLPPELQTIYDVKTSDLLRLHQISRNDSSNVSSSASTISTVSSSNVSNEIRKMQKRKADEVLANISSKGSSVVSGGENNRSQHPLMPDATHHQQQHRQKIIVDLKWRDVEFPKCPHCLKSVSGATFEHHISTCYANVRQCKYCGINTQVLEIDRHEASCSLNKKPCPICNVPFPIANLTEHHRACRRRRVQSSSNSQHNITDSSTSYEGVLKQLRNTITGVTETKLCPLCNQLVPKATYLSHFDQCEENKRSCQFCKEGIQTLRLEKHESECQHNVVACYLCGFEIPRRQMAQHVDVCRNGDRQYTMYHGTSAGSANQILADGGRFRQSANGMLGQGVYLTRDFQKAMNYGPVVFELRVDLGRVAVIDHKGHPLQKTWHSEGYDSAWVPPQCGMVASGFEESCVWDPRRVMVVRSVSYVPK